jgi:Ferritin-like domain
MAESRSIAATVAGTGPAEVLAALQLLLQVEYLRSALYARAQATPGLVPTTDARVYTILADQSSAQLLAITTAITIRAGLPAPSPTFDFTVKGTFPGFAFAVGQYATLQMLSQVVQDFGVRAYLGQFPALATDKVALNTALAILTVQGRHASQVRRLRGLKGWITGKSRDDLPAFAQPVYDGEENVVQGAVNVSTIAQGFGDAAAATQAFDEPLTAVEVNAILALFAP